MIRADKGRVEIDGNIGEVGADIMSLMYALTQVLTEDEDMAKAIFKTDSKVVIDFIQVFVEATR